MPLVPEAEVEFFVFDKAYVDRLRDGDPTTEHHFVSYFEPLLRIKLRSRMLSSDRVDDLRQETFKRVFDKIRQEGGVRQPERFGAFVNSVCNFVLQEYYRTSKKNQQIDDPQVDVPDKVLDLELTMVSRQTGEQVRKILAVLPRRDRELLKAVFLEEKDKDEVCRQMGVDRDYLRVLVHRAKDKFRELYEKGETGSAYRVTQYGNR